DTNPDGSVLYVANYDDSTVSIIDLTTRKVKAKVTVPPFPDPEPAISHPLSIAVASTGVVLIGMESDDPRVMQLNPSTYAVSIRSDLDGPFDADNALLRASGDRSVIGLSSYNDAATYSAASDTFSVRQVFPGIKHIATDASGDMFMLGND